MPHIPIKFKSDKEIEEELKVGFKVRRHNPLDFENQYVCWVCSNLIQPKCNLGVTPHPCDLDCPIVVFDKKIGDLCEQYEEAKCKKGYYVSGIPMHCPDYDGPKPEVKYFSGFVMINFGKRKTEPENK